MEQTKWHRIGSWVWPVLLVLTTAAIWGQSLMSGESSSNESGAVRELLVRLFGEEFVGSFLYTYIRKVAHFTEYMVLGAEWTAYRLHRRPGRGTAWLFWAAGPLTAVCDELLQFLSPGRGPAVRDVLLDCSGCVCGWLAAWLLCRLLRAAAARRKKRRGS